MYDVSIVLFALYSNKVILKKKKKKSTLVAFEEYNLVVLLLINWPEQRIEESGWGSGWARFFEFAQNRPETRFLLFSLSLLLPANQMPGKNRDQHEPLISGAGQQDRSPGGGIGQHGDCLRIV